MWPFMLIRHLSATHVVSGSKEDILALLHDSEKFTRLNPLVISVSPTGENNTYKIVDKLHVLGSYSTTTEYTCQFTNVEDGIDTVVNAGMKTTSRAKWRVRTMKEGMVEISEETDVEMLFLLLPFIMGTMKAAHSEAILRISGSA